MPKPTAWLVSHSATASTTASRRETVAAAITAKAAKGVTHVNTTVIAALIATSNPSHTGRNHSALRSGIFGSFAAFPGPFRGRPGAFSPPRLPATGPVDNGRPNLDNTRAHERGDSRDPEDDERGFPARDPVPELGARPLGRAPEKPLP